MAAERKWGAESEVVAVRAREADCRSLAPPQNAGRRKRAVLGMTREERGASQRRRPRENHRDANSAPEASGTGKSQRRRRDAGGTKAKAALRVAKVMVATACWVNA